MGFPEWIAYNWFEFLQTAGILAGFSTTVYTLQLDKRARQIGNAIEITKGHRELWMHFANRPALKGIFDPSPKSAPSHEESIFINQLILHLKVVYKAGTYRMYDRPQGLQDDIQDFFSNPKPRRVWEKNKRFHEDGFVSFVERCFHDSKNSNV